MILGIGEILWDLLPGGRRMGGAPANFAYHASRFGLAAAVVSAVGCDEAGDEALKWLGRHGLGGGVTRVGFPTGTVDVTLDGAGVPSYRIREEVAWDYIPFTPAAELIRGAECVCFGTLAQRSPVSRRTIGRLLDSLPSGALAVFDVNLRGGFCDADVVKNSLEHCNVLKINDQEIGTVAALEGLRGDDGRICRELADRYSLRAVILTRGGAGSDLYADGRFSHEEVRAGRVVDTVGAGDSFTAAFCAVLLQGGSYAEAHRLAADTASFVCSCEGATPDFGLFPPHLRFPARGE